MNEALMKLLGLTVCYAPEGSGGGGDGGSGGEPGASSSGDAAASADGGDASTALGGNKPAEAGAGADGADDKNSDGDKPEDDGKEAEKGNETDQDSEPIKIAAPEGFEQYQSEFDNFATDMDGWVKANPDASTREILAEAANRQARLVAEQEASNAKAFSDQVTAWEGEARADKEIGGDKFDANVAQAVRAVDAFGGQELKDILNQSGLGSHPVIIKAFHKAGAQLGESKVEKPSATGSEKSFADKFYD